MDYNHNGKIDKEDLIIEEEMTEVDGLANKPGLLQGCGLVILGLLILWGITRIL